MTVCLSYENVYSGLLFFRTQCRLNVIEFLPNKQPLLVIIAFQFCLRYIICTVLRLSLTLQYYLTMKMAIIILQNNG